MKDWETRLMDEHEELEIKIEKYLTSLMKILIMKIMIY